MKRSLSGCCLKKEITMKRNRREQLTNGWWIMKEAHTVEYSSTSTTKRQTIFSLSRF